MRYKERDNTEQEINISPLIAIVFILLIFFMVSATFVKDYDLDINRPKASSATPSSSKAIRVHVDSVGEVFIDGQPVRTWVIQNYVRDKLSNSSDSTVLVIADEGVAAGKLIEVVDQCRLAGAANVGVVTEQESG
ncbi:MAG: biopolymer transporter ExbD [Gammaproteobacteria bacterium]|jgi:biopolymer transport protein ExbD|nr:biopolymer transporter ExbD [Gammaproteobacteria bacterium]